MNSKFAKPFLLLIGFILIVGLACSVATPEEVEAPAAPVEEVVEEVPPTDVAPPTNVPEPTATAVPEPTTPPPTPTPDRFFTEEFGDDFAGWPYIYFADDDSGFDIYSENDRLVFDIQDEYNWIYAYYEDQVYDDVRLETEVNNRGANTNNVSLICRLDLDEGWYEFNISNGGLYTFYAYDIAGNTGYNELVSGGVQNIKTGKETNQYAITCDGKTLTLYVNGKEIKSYDENKYGFNEGMVGISVSSFEILPVKVEFEWLQIMEP